MVQEHASFVRWSRTPGVLLLWSREQQAELSSLQSSLNSTNRICYRCNGWNKGREAEMRCGFLEVVSCALKNGLCVCVYVGVFAHDRKIWRWLTISAYFSLQQRMHPPQFFPSVSAELYMTEALFFFSLPSFLCLFFSCCSCNNILNCWMDYRPAWACTLFQRER